MSHPDEISDSLAELEEHLERAVAATRRLVAASPGPLSSSLEVIASFVLLVVRTEALWAWFAPQLAALLGQLVGVAQAEIERHGARGRASVN